jgi:hypothetical protein
MKFGIFTPTGACLRVGECADEYVQLQCQEGELLYVGECSINDRIDPVTKALIPNGQPPRPSWEHDWDEVSVAWVGSLDRARARKHADIEAERNRRLTAPVLVYDGKNLDAREQDIRNLEQKLATVQSRIDQGIAAPVDTLVWRDHDDQLHSFADLATYKTWLDGFAIALDERNTAAWSWSWQKKAELAACTTFDQVITLAL